MYRSREMGRGGIKLRILSCIVKLAWGGVCVCVSLGRGSLNAVLGFQGTLSNRDFFPSVSSPRSPSPLCLQRWPGHMWSQRAAGFNRFLHAGTWEDREHITLLGEDHQTLLAMKDERPQKLRAQRLLQPRHPVGTGTERLRGWPKVTQLPVWASQQSAL